MKTFIKFLSVAAVVSSLSGCVVAVGNGEGDWDDSDSNWRKTQQANLGYINNLKIGTSAESVRSNLGSPAFVETFQRQGETVEVLFYRTNHRHSDGETSKDECTPLVFKRGQLVGWGDKAYQAM